MAAKDGYILERQAGHLLRRAHQRHSAIFQEKIGDYDHQSENYPVLHHEDAVDSASGQGRAKSVTTSSPKDPEDEQPSSRSDARAQEKTMVARGIVLFLIFHGFLVDVGSVLGGKIRPWTLI